MWSVSYTHLVHLADATEGKARRATLEQDSGAEGALMAMDLSLIHI